MKFEWEDIDGYHLRAKVIGGWVLKTLEDVTHDTEYNGYSSGWDWRVSTCFIPDPKWEWEIEK